MHPNIFYVYLLNMWICVGFCWSLSRCQYIFAFLFCACWIGRVPGWIFDNHFKCEFYIFSHNFIKITTAIMCDIQTCFMVKMILHILLNPPKRWLSWHKLNPYHNNASHTCMSFGIIKYAILFYILLSIDCLSFIILWCTNSIGS